LSEKIYSVSEVNANIKSILTSKPELKNIWVKGEISNLSTSGTGHTYFSLKEPNSLIRCTFFSYSRKNYKGKSLEDGMQVQVYGSITVYEPSGAYNLNVTQVQPIGIGDILARVEKLKQELKTKGIFDTAHKKPLPRLPKRLGIATSSFGAAIEDIIRLAKDRYPNIDILIAPCVVQGEEAVASIITAIRALNDPQWEVDVIIAGRGGGSYEDLMAFNDERIVMEYYNSRVPIVSAVGHQVDSLLSDFAADAYAPTPSAAAEMVIPELENLELYVEEMEDRIQKSLTNLIRWSSDQLRLISNKRSLTEPTALLTDRSQKVDDLLSRITLLGKNFLAGKKSRLQNFDILSYKTQTQIEKKKNAFLLASERLENFSPLLTLKRGYSVVRDAHQKVITSYKQVKQGDTIEIILSEGRVQTNIISISSEK
jgi:exodeoxyribonuclease VII large subunit